MEQPASGRDLTLLAEGSIELLGRIPRSSNETFLVEVTRADDASYAVYKPEAGERPLSDFEPSLYRRERAAYLLSESLGWGLVPPTVIREWAPLGVGSLQWFVECDFQEHYFTLYADAPETHRELARIAQFDYVTNNTDRKSGHLLKPVSIAPLRVFLGWVTGQVDWRVPDAHREVQRASHIWVRCVRGRGRKPVVPQSTIDEIVDLTRNSKPEGQTHWSVRTMAAMVGANPGPGSF